MCLVAVMMFSQSRAIQRVPNYSPDYCFSLVMGDWCHFSLTEVKEDLLNFDSYQKIFLLDVFCL